MTHLPPERDRQMEELSAGRQLPESTTSLQAEIDGFLKSITAAA